MSDEDPYPHPDLPPTPGLPPDPGGSTDGDITTTVAPDVIAPKDPNLYLPIYVMTGIFAGIFILVPFFFRKGRNSGIIRCSIMIAAFSMWLFWITVYIAQMNPLLGPRLRNETLAWIAHSWGLNPKPAQPPSSGAGGANQTPGPGAGSVASVSTESDDGGGDR